MRGLPRVELQGDGLRAGLGDRGDHLFRLGTASVVGEDRGNAATREAEHGVAASPAASASNDGNSGLRAGNVCLLA